MLARTGEKRSEKVAGAVTFAAMGWIYLVSFTNPLAAGSGLVERTPKKVGGAVTFAAMGWIYQEHHGWFPTNVTRLEMQLKR